MNAFEWLQQPGDARPVAVALFGAPISRASISPSEAWATPSAFRSALRRFSTWDAEHRTDLADLRLLDLGDVRGDHEDPDVRAAHDRIQSMAARAASHATTVAVIGGDNSLTRPVFHGLQQSRSDRTWGLLTLDAHHDCRPLRDGPRNGTPVRELLDGGLPGSRVAQIGIHPFANERDQADWAAAQGVHIHPRAEVAAKGIVAVVTDALAALVSAGATAIHADIDVDVVDRSAAPACPASLPGGISASELLEASHALGSSPLVHGVDITEVDANADINGITVRLAAAAFLAFCSGVLARPASSRS